MFVVRLLSVLQKHSFYSFPSTRRPFATIHSTILLLISLIADLKKYRRVLSKLNSLYTISNFYKLRSQIFYSHSWIIRRVVEFLILYHFKAEAKKCLHVSINCLHVVSLFVLQHKFTNFTNFPFLWDTLYNSFDIDTTQKCIFFNV